MNKDNIRLSTTVSPKFDNIFRRHAYLLRKNNNEVLELYQAAYLREQEREKAEKKAAKEAKEKEQQAKNGENKEKK
jgi:Skp family chaperone for outer membrane proteins